MGPLSVVENERETDVAIPDLLCSLQLWKPIPGLSWVYIHVAEGRHDALSDSPARSASGVGKVIPQKEPRGRLSADRRQKAWGQATNTTPSTSLIEPLLFPSHLVDSPTRLCTPVNE